MSYISKLRLFLFSITLISSLFFGCDSIDDEVIPYTYVNYTIDMQNPEYVSLHDFGGYAIIENQGYKTNGIIVYASGIDEYKAYDCTCTYEVNSCNIAKDSSNILHVKCNCCETVYELMYGSVVSGSATYGLHEYQTNYNGTFLKIFN